MLSIQENFGVNIYEPIVGSRNDFLIVNSQNQEHDQ